MENVEMSGLGIVVICIIVFMLFYIWLAFKSWIDIDESLNNGNDAYTYITKNKHNKIIFRHRKGFRERPPNASFFGRIGGREVTLEGPYEEKFLDVYERARWKRKMKEKGEVD